MKTDWKRIIAEDEKFTEFLKEFALLQYVEIGNQSLPFIYANYQSGLSAKQLSEILKISSYLQSN